MSEQVMQTPAPFSQIAPGINLSSHTLVDGESDKNPSVPALPNATIYLTDFVNHAITELPHYAIKNSNSYDENSTNGSSGTSYSSRNFNEREYEPYHKFMVGSRHWVQRVFVPVVLLIGFLGNSVTILVLSRPRMRSSTNTYLTALATSDLLYLLSVFSLSLQHHPHMSHPRHWLYWHYCKYAYWIADASSEFLYFT